MKWKSSPSSIHRRILCVPIGHFPPTASVAPRSSVTRRLTSSQFLSHGLIGGSLFSLPGCHQLGVESLANGLLGFGGLFGSGVSCGRLHAKL